MLYIHHEAKVSQTSPDSLWIQGPSEKPSSDLLYLVSPEQEHNQNDGNTKSLGFYSHLFLVPKPHQKVRPFIDLSRLNTFFLVEKLRMETPESIKCLSGSLGVGFVNRPLVRLSPFPNPSNLKEVPSVQPQISNLSIHLSSFQPSHSPSDLYNNSKGGKADGPLQKDQSSPIP